MEGIGGGTKARSGSNAVVEGPARETVEFVRPPSARSRVLIAIQDLAFHQEVLDFLERDARIEVTGAATDPDRFMRLLVDLAPDVTVVCPGLAPGVRHPAARSRTQDVLVITEEMTVPVLREAIDAGARGVFCWPEERRELAKAITRLPSDRGPRSPGRGRVIAVYGARGGSGVTFVSTHLAAAFADRGLRSLLVDLDSGFAGLTVALGIGPSEAKRTIADLLPVLEELSPDHLEDALYRHRRGFSVLLGPPEGVDPSSISPGLYAGAIALLAGDFDVIVLHLPRALDDVAKTGAGLADELLLVASLDLFSLYGARRALTSLGLTASPGRCRLVINRLGSAQVTPKDVERVLGVPTSVGVRFDAAVKRVQDRGELLSSRSRRAGKDVRVLAGLIASQASLVVQEKA
jgi:Flp pilus assembly CpaE family ATPase